MNISVHVVAIPQWHTKRDMRHGRYEATLTIVEGITYTAQGRSASSAIRKAVDMAAHAIYAGLNNGA